MKPQFLGTSRIWADFEKLKNIFKCFSHCSKRKNVKVMRWYPFSKSNNFSASQTSGSTPFILTKNYVFLNAYNKISTKKKHFPWNSESTTQHMVPITI